MYIGEGLVRKHGAEKKTSTFRWEVRFALSFVWPVYDQVPEATETVGDLIYKNEENRKNRLQCPFLNNVS